MVVTIEPGLFPGAEDGIRIEDDLLITGREAARFYERRSPKTVRECGGSLVDDEGRIRNPKSEALRNPMTKGILAVSPRYSEDLTLPRRVGAYPSSTSGWTLAPLSFVIR